MTARSSIDLSPGPVWDRAAEMILIAARTGERADIAEATRQLLVALGHENWWKPASTRELSRARQ